MSVALGAEDAQKTGVGPVAVRVRLETDRVGVLLGGGVGIDGFFRQGWQVIGQKNGESRLLFKLGKGGRENVGGRLRFLAENKLRQAQKESAAHNYKTMSLSLRWSDCRIHPHPACRQTMLPGDAGVTAGPVKP